jgi:hypothetical protein
MRFVVVFALAACSLPDIKTWHRTTYSGAGRSFAPKLTYDTNRHRVVMYEPAAGIVYALDPNAKRWTAICGANAPTAHYTYAGFAYDPVLDRYVLAGGITDRKVFATAVADAAECDPASDAWTSNPLPKPRALGYMLYDPHHGLRLFGGDDDTVTGQDSVFELDATNVWHEVTPTNNTRTLAATGATATYVAETDQIVMLRQDTGMQGIDYDELWAMGATSDGWTLLCMACTGQPRDDASIVAVPGGDQYILNGYHDNGGAEIAGTWIRAADGRSAVVDAANITARDTEGAVYDPDRDVIVVYGGNGVGCGNNDCDDTWELGPN